MANDVFISYASEDRDKARSLAEFLGSAGLNVWWDRHIRPGERFDAVIDAALGDARCVVVLWSGASVASDWVQAEAQEGLDRRSLVPVLIDNARVPLGFRRLNAVDLRGWPHTHPPEELQRLCERIGGVTEGSNAARAPLRSVEPQPSVAMLPLLVMNGAENGDGLAAGVTSEVIGALSRLPGFFVIAFGSTWAYRGEPRDPRSVSAELGVRYVVQGSLLRAGQRVRIMVELVDAPSRKQLWSESFDIALTLADLIDLQHEIASGIAGRLQPRLLSAERLRNRAKAPETLEAWQLVHRARPAYVTNESGAESMALLKRAIELDPGYVEAHALLGQQLSFMSVVKDPRYAEPARAAIDRALALDPDNELALMASGMSLINLGQYEAALACCERAVELNPNLANAWAHLGFATLGARKDGNAGLIHIGRAFALSPRDEAAHLWYHLQAPCFAQAGDVRAAAEATAKSVRHYPGWFFSWLCRAQYLALLEDTAGTHQAWMEAKRRYPPLTLDLYRRMAQFSPLSAELNRQIVAALDAAGVD